jgi:enoyl-CoA hydratase/carnithine racemase
VCRERDDTTKDGTVPLVAYETILYEVDDDHVATVTLNRPDKLNSFNMAMRRDFRQLWRDIQDDDAVHAVVLRAAGDRAFSTGIDATERADMMARGVHVGAPPNPFVAEDPGITLAPKQNECWKPIVCAVHGMAAGGAFYWINESDIVIASDDATFFDPHVTYGMTSALEPVGLKWRIPLGEVLRWALMGLDERMSAERAREIGLVSEVVERNQLWERAHEIAAIVAAKPTVATQGTVKAIWQSLDLTRSASIELGMMYVQIGNPVGEQQVDRSSAPRPKPQIR